MFTRAAFCSVLVLGFLDLGLINFWLAPRLRARASPGGSPAPVVSPAAPARPVAARVFAASRAAPASRPVEKEPSPPLPSPPLQFDTSSAALDGTAAVMLRRVASLLQQRPELSLHVRGHADSRGLRERNLALSVRRARAVATLLRSLGVPEGRVTVVGVGDREPLDSGPGEASWARNRRVELVWNLGLEGAHVR